MKVKNNNATIVANENKNNVINSNNEVMQNNEVTINAEVKKVAFVGGNRAINKNNVKRQLASLKKFHRNITPLLYVEAGEIEGYRIYEAGTDNQIAPCDFSDYIVILDGQHRFMAAKQLASSEDAGGFTLDDLLWQRIELKDDSFTDILTEVNTVTTKWSGADYISGCIFQNPNDAILQFANELTHLGVPSKTVNKYLFLKEKFSWAKVMKTEDENVRSQLFSNSNADLDRAKEIWDFVKTFPENVITTSVVIDYILSKGGTRYWRNEFENMKTLKNKEQLKDLKGKKLVAKFEEMMNNLKLKDE